MPLTRTNHPPLTTGYVRNTLLALGLWEDANLQSARQYRWHADDTVASLHVALSALDPRPEVFRVTDRWIVFGEGANA